MKERRIRITRGFPLAPVGKEYEVAMDGDVWLTDRLYYDIGDLEGYYVELHQCKTCKKWKYEPYECHCSGGVFGIDPAKGDDSTVTQDIYKCGYCGQIHAGKLCVQEIERLLTLLLRLPDQEIHQLAKKRLSIIIAGNLDKKA